MKACGQLRRTQRATPSIRREQVHYPFLLPRGLFSGRSMIWSVNDGSSGGVATVGSGLAEGSPKGGAPAAGATQRRKQPPTSTPRRLSRVCSDGAAPKASLTREGQDRPELIARSLGSGPMSFTLGTHQRPSTKALNTSSTARGRFSTQPFDLPKILRDPVWPPQPEGIAA